MPKDSNSFKLRFLYYKQTGKLPYKAGRVNEELVTDAIQSRQIPIELQQDPLGMLKRLDIARANAAKVTAMLNQALIGTKVDVSQQLQNYYADKEDTRRFMLRKQEGEELADKIFGTAFDVATLYVPAARVGWNMMKGAAGALKSGVKSAVNLSKNWRPTVPSDPSRYYRIVGEVGDPIGDAIESGAIRGPGVNPAAREALQEANNASGKISLAAKAHSYPMFSKGSVWKGSTSRSAGDSGKPFVIRSKKDTGPIVWEESNVDFRHKGHAGIFRPRFFGDLNASPALYFEYWEPKRFGYMRREFPISSEKVAVPSSVVTNSINLTKPENNIINSLFEEASIPYEELQMFKNSVLERMADARGITDPALRKKFILDGMSKVGTKYNRSSILSNPLAEGTADPITGTITIKPGSEEFALGHEMRHRLDYVRHWNGSENFTLTPEEYGTLRKAYTAEFLDYPAEYPMQVEMVTTNADVRKQLLGKLALRDLSVAEQNAKIDAATGTEVLNALKNANDYGNYYYRALMTNPIYRENNAQLMINILRNIKAATKYVGAFGVPTALSVPLLNNTNNEK